ncbi:MAG: BolA family protein [Paracoccus sp. (in: a-proteobacteria)]|uniref:BolA family protein n=1 Tax=Paracoccus sp. TaxID=267 RepID=UPI0026DFE47A|nr:BolA family protein [Paracoccus sp. (in: a-proteobacteria)]MDO5630398.1 BolA family protein [Paracoccus sp. (in: a-proteobacteria)]
MIADDMRDRLMALNPVVLEIADESEQHQGHAGWREGGQTHFRICLISPDFQGKSRIDRHRMVHAALGDIVPRIHALALELDTPTA